MCKYDKHQSFNNKLFLKPISPEFAYNIVLKYIVRLCVCVCVSFDYVDSCYEMLYLGWGVGLQVARLGNGQTTFN